MIKVTEHHLLYSAYPGQSMSPSPTIVLSLSPLGIRIAHSRLLCEHFNFSSSLRDSVLFCIGKRIFFSISYLHFYQLYAWQALGSRLYGFEI
jgi:hypothetical protein